MSQISSWIKAARLRTLPLAFSSILMGGGLALFHNGFNLFVVILALLTAFLLQVLSNFANDYGDFASGVDNGKRVGPTRAVQSGALTSRQMKSAIFLFSVLSLASGLVMIFVVSEIPIVARVVFVGLGLLSILAAILYTVGKNPYGYRGLGEVFVFLFFGVLGVGGTFFLSVGHWNWSVLLPAMAIGLLAAGVLNINNMRDIENDLASNKRTIATRIGLNKAKKFQASVVLLPFLFLLLFVSVEGLKFFSHGFLIVFPLFFGDILAIKKSEGGTALDPFLSRLSMKTFILTVIFVVMINV